MICEGIDLYCTDCRCHVAIVGHLRAGAPPEERAAFLSSQRCHYCNPTPCWRCGDTSGKPAHTCVARAAGKKAGNP